MSVQSPAEKHRPDPTVAAPERRRRRQGRARRSWSNGLGLTVVALFFLVWEAASRFEIVDSFTLPPFSTVMEALYDLFKSGELMDAVLASLGRAAAGFGLAAIVGVVLGLAIGWSALASKSLSPVLELFRQLPTLAMYPVFILFLGLGFKAQVAMVFWGSLWPILLNTVNGCRQIDPTLVKAARSYDVSNWQMFVTVLLPSAIPVISTGLRLGGTYALLVLVAAEMIGPQSGIGFLILNSQYNIQIPNMYAAILVLAVMGLILNAALVRAEKRITRWQQGQ